jgi:4-amino-4-deoxy-L-arabinose transferase-like glycosyltransferase
MTADRPAEPSLWEPADRRTAVVAWALAVVVAVGVIGLTHYESADPDSSLHAGISARLSQQPVARWIAPEWWGFWSGQGPYCEHPVGIFILPAALARLGYPPLQAAYAVNVLYQAASFILIGLVAVRVAAPRDARALGWLLQLLPIAFVFRIRANHEYAVLAGLLFAVYSTERARRRPAWTLGMVFGFCAVLLVKGVFAVMVPVACAAWLLARAAQPGDIRRHWRAWAAVAAMPLAGALAAWGYEAAYAHVTGRSFLAVYQSRQLPAAAVTGGSLVARTAYTAAWYAARLFWYPFPWSLLAGAVAWRGVRGGAVWPWGRGRRGAAAGMPAPLQQGAWFAIATSAMLAGVFSLAHRKADRYLFPVYFIVAAAGAIEALNRFGRLRRLVEQLDRPWVPAAVYVGLLILRVVTVNKLPEFTFWRT